MDGKGRIEAAFSNNGTEEFPVVVCYPGLFYRDHCRKLTSLPWWYQYETDLQRQVLFFKEVILNSGLDWFQVTPSYSKKDRTLWHLSVEADGVFLLHQKTREKKILQRPQVGGVGTRSSFSHHPHNLPKNRDTIDAWIEREFLESKDLAVGQEDLAKELLALDCSSLFPVFNVPSPFWRCYHLWGFEEMMYLVASNPKLVAYACEQFLFVSINEVKKGLQLGARGIWIEECFSDQISPRSYEILSLPYVKELIQGISDLGLKSIYYFTGDIQGKMDQILSARAHAYSFEEGKKGFLNQIQDIVDQVQGEAVLFGNIDSVGTLQNGTPEQLKEEISKQKACGKKNKNRFIMSTGSPVTPSTSLERIYLYRNLTLSLE